MEGRCHCPDWFVAIFGHVLPILISKKHFREPDLLYRSIWMYRDETEWVTLSTLQLKDRQDSDQLISQSVILSSEWVIKWVDVGKWVDAINYYAPNFDFFEVGFGLCILPSVQEPCMLGFWNFIYGFLMEKYLTHIFFSCPNYLPFWSYAPLNKIRMKSDACHILWTVHARV